MLLLALAVLTPTHSVRAEGEVDSLAGTETILFGEIPSVYTASKYEQKVTEAPSAVSVVTADEIRKHGHRTLADVLRTVPGFYGSDDRTCSAVSDSSFRRYCRSIDTSHMTTQIRNSATKVRVRPFTRNVARFWYPTRTAPIPKPVTAIAA